MSARVYAARRTIRAGRVKRVFGTLADVKRHRVTMLLVDQNAQPRALRLADRAYVMELGTLDPSLG